MMTHSDIQARASEINSRDMKEVLEEHGIEVRRRGSGYVALCPWHDDHHPSLVVYEHTCWCPVCMDHRKSVIDTLMKVKGMTFKEVVGGDSPPALPVREGAGRRWGEREKEEREWGEREWESHNKEKVPQKTPPNTNYLRIEDIYSICNVSMSSSSMSSSSHRTPALPLTGERGEGLGLCLSDCSLAKCMKTRFHPALVDKIAHDYRLICYPHFGNDDDTLFPNIDRHGRVHNVKLQRYETDRRSERFFHCDRKCTYWMGAIWKRQGKIPQDTQIDMDCLFGEHLLAERPNCDVVVVESPKNAVVGAAAFPRMVWVATGSKSLLCRERMECLRGRRVIVIPDTDAIADWREKISSMQDIASFVISSLTEEIMKIGDKADVADWLVGELTIDD